MDDRMCSTLLKGMNLLPLGRTMFCAGFPDGEKDACQVGTKHKQAKLFYNTWVRVNSAFPMSCFGELLLQNSLFLHLSTWLLLKRFTCPGLREFFPVLCPIVPSTPLFFHRWEWGSKRGSSLNISNLIEASKITTLAS